MLETQTKPETETKPLVYDADADQRIKFDTFDGDDQIVFVFQPITDGRYIEFAEKSRLKLVDGGENLLSDNSTALVELWNDVITDVEGIEGEKPDNWRDEMDADREKIPSITALLTVAAYTETKRSWGQRDDSVITEAYFNNKPVSQKHFLRKKSLEDVRAYRKFQKIPVGGKGKGLKAGDIIIPSYAGQKAALYDRMQTKEAEGYAGRVPVWHKIAVIDYIFSAGITQKK